MLISKLNAAAATKCRRHWRSASASAGGGSMPISHSAADFLLATSACHLLLANRARQPVRGTTAAARPRKLPYPNLFLKGKFGY